MRKTVKEIAKWLNVETNGFDDVVVTGVTIDSRMVKEGDLFIPFRGESTNGHRYVEDAFKKGAVCSLWLKDEPNPPKGQHILFVDDSEQALQQMARKYREELRAKIVGVTGSNGKTSTKDILASLLTPYYKVQKTIGNFNNELGLPLTILSLDEDTEIAVLEMGMSGFGEIEFLSTLAKPHYAIITNIGEAHMQDLGSREGIARAKFEIIRGLDENGVLFYDGDEPLLVSLVQKEANLQSKSFGFSTTNQLTAVNIATTEEGRHFTEKGELQGEFFIPILGKHQVKNTLSAMLVAKALGLSDEDIRKALKQVSLTDMRMQLISLGDLLFINDAYNAAPTSMKAAIDFMKSTTLKEDKWLVLGDMLELGENEKEFHEQLAESIDEKEISRVCLFGPRMKSLYVKLVPIFNERLVYSEDNYEVIIETIQKYASNHSLILLKGSRGMKLETILNAFK